MLLDQLSLSDIVTPKVASGQQAVSHGEASEETSVQVNQATVEKSSKDDEASSAASGEYVTIVNKDTNQSWRILKSIAVRQSEHFDTALSPKWQESHPGEIHLAGDDSQALALVMAFLPKLTLTHPPHHLDHQITFYRLLADSADEHSSNMFELLLEVFAVAHLYTMNFILYDIVDDFLCSAVSHYIAPDDDRDHLGPWVRIPGAPPLWGPKEFIEYYIKPVVEVMENNYPIELCAVVRVAVRLFMTESSKSGEITTLFKALQEYPALACNINEYLCTLWKVEHKKVLQLEDKLEEKEAELEHTRSYGRGPYGNHGGSNGPLDRWW
ncbi:uncharacterized protein AB675_167 [Cyphellophora attinorum]|uniref:BTB domain-containing protein n=1 Tax=Cyphellophora attinorum TaxID=1664694 RepID=A0A0N1NX00_9EURO|nr:uncharacterized protein AB675_167 [Phialophora attinorum]KPI37665.1 hypothetical protein AB675_167 [Phialophora attinorum]